MCARKYGPLGHQTDKIRNDGISSYEVSGLFLYLVIKVNDVEVSERAGSAIVLFQNMRKHISEVRDQLRMAVLTLFLLLLALFGSGFFVPCQRAWV